MNFSVYWKQFQGNACMTAQQSLRWNFNKIRLQASINTFNNRLAEVVEILKTVSYGPASSLSQGAKGLEKRIHNQHRHVLFIYLLMTDKLFQPVSH